MLRLRLSWLTYEPPNDNTAAIADDGADGEVRGSGRGGSGRVQRIRQGLRCRLDSRRVAFERREVLGGDRRSVGDLVLQSLDRGGVGGEAGAYFGGKPLNGGGVCGEVGMERVRHREKPFCVVEDFLKQLGVAMEMDMDRPIDLEFQSEHGGSILQHENARKLQFRV